MSMEQTQQSSEKQDFARTVAFLQGGATIHELTCALEELVAQCVLTGKKGQLQFTINVLPDGAGKVKVTDDVKVKAPKFPRKETVFFANEHGELSRKRPRQGELFDEEEDGKSRAAV